MFKIKSICLIDLNAIRLAGSFKLLIFLFNVRICLRIKIRIEFLLGVLGSIELPLPRLRLISWSLRKLLLLLLWWLLVLSRCSESLWASWILCLLLCIYILLIHLLLILHLRKLLLLYRFLVSLVIELLSIIQILLKRTCSCSQLGKLIFLWHRYILLHCLCLVYLLIHSTITWLNNWRLYWLLWWHICCLCDLFINWKHLIDMYSG